MSVHFERGDRLHKRLKACRLDASYEQEMRKLIGVDLLIVDDVTLQALDVTATSDFYDLVVERHRRAATVLTSNRDTSEWLAVMADPLLAQSAIDRLTSAAWELVIEGESYRRREKPTLTPTASQTASRDARRDPSELTAAPPVGIISLAGGGGSRGGPMLLAKGWSHRAGERRGGHGKSRCGAGVLLDRIVGRLGPAPPGQRRPLI